MDSSAAVKTRMQGFTFLELIIALAILAIILMMSLYTVSQMSKMSESQKNMRNASDALRGQAEIVKGMPYLDLKAGRTYPFDSRDIYIQYLPQGQGTFTVGDYLDIEGVKPVTIEVKWKDPRGWKRLHTVVLRTPSSQTEAEDEITGNRGEEESP